MLTILFVSSIYGYCQKVDTLYYDENWKGVQNVEFAAYRRVLSYSQDANYANKYKDYYISGELQGEGDFYSIDKYDDKNSVFGKSKTYYKNGKLSGETTVVNGSGDQTSYYENGLIHIKRSLKNNKLDGIYYEFGEDGSYCMQLAYANGEPITEYITISNNNGQVSRYWLKDQTPYLEQPTESERKTYPINGTIWDYYEKNGITLYATAVLQKNYGKYYTIHIRLANNSAQPIVIDPSQIEAICTYKKKEIPMDVLLAEEFDKRVKRSQSVGMFFNALGEGLAAAGAGYSSSTTRTNSHYSGGSNTKTSYSGGSAYGRAAGVVGTNGAAVGVGVGASTYAGNVNSSTHYSGSSSTTSTTTNYDGAAAYQAHLIASDRIASYNEQMAQTREVLNKGYLKITTIKPGEYISGEVRVKFKKADNLHVKIPILGINYPFVWNVGK